MIDIQQGKTDGQIQFKLSGSYADVMKQEE
jgi:hypothetical protein